MTSTAWTIGKIGLPDVLVAAMFVTAQRRRARSTFACAWPLTVKVAFCRLYRFPVCESVYFATRCVRFRYEDFRLLLLSLQPRRRSICSFLVNLQSFKTTCLLSYRNPVSVYMLFYHMHFIIITIFFLHVFQGFIQRGRSDSPGWTSMSNTGWRVFLSESTGAPSNGQSEEVTGRILWV